MEYIALGNSGISVSRLCFGALTIGPLQANMSTCEGAEVIAYALNRGVNFIDTAQLYKTYHYIKKALSISQKFDTIISSKTYAYTREMAIDAVEQARRELDRDVIDIFMLHQQESKHTLRGHKDALDVLLEYKSKGIIRAVGASTHHIALVNDVCDKNCGIDVIHPLINRVGIGIEDGTIGEMLLAVQRVYSLGIGIFGMKALGGGNLINERLSSLKFVLDLPYVHSIAVGMQSIDEVEANINFFEGIIPSEGLENRLSKQKRRLHIENWCVGCGKCTKHCVSNALSIVDGLCIVKSEKCILCGYCGANCPEFAIKIC